MESAVQIPDIKMSIHLLRGLRLERSIKHYSNFHQILLVGEGDFSFSLALANAFGSAENMVTTSLDSKDKVLELYKSAHETLSNLEKLGANVIFGIDATTMEKHPIIRKMRFHRIVFNFPHAGFYERESAETVIEKHRYLLKMFFMNAMTILSVNGEIHVSHKESEPYKKWELVKQAEECGLLMKESVPFTVSEYPGYTNRKCSGRNAGRTFPLGECRTYKFVLGPENFMKPESERKQITAGEMERAYSETIFNFLNILANEEIYKSDEFARQMADKDRQREKIETRLKEVNLELKSERRAREAAKIAQADSEMSLKDLKVKLNKELNKSVVFARQMADKDHQREKIETSLKEVNLELKSERRAREAAEIAQADSEMSLKDLKVKLNEELNKSDKFARQMADKDHQREKIEKSLKEVNLELKSERRTREAAEIAQADSEMSLKDLKVKLNRELNRNYELMKQRDELFLQTEEALRLQVDAVKQRDRTVWKSKVVSFVLAIIFFFNIFSPPQPR